MSAKPYSVITQHGQDRAVKRVRFATFEEAQAHGGAHTPETDGSMVPQLDEQHVKHRNYEAGLFWYGNRYGAIHKTRDKGYRA